MRSDTNICSGLLCCVIESRFGTVLRIERKPRGLWRVSTVLCVEPAGLCALSKDSGRFYLSKFNACPKPVSSTNLRIFSLRCEGDIERFSPGTCRPAEKSFLVDRRFAPGAGDARQLSRQRRGVAAAAAAQASGAGARPIIYRLDRNALCMHARKLHQTLTYVCLVSEKGLSSLIMIGRAGAIRSQHNAASASRFCGVFPHLGICIWHWEAVGTASHGMA